MPVLPPPRTLRLCLGVATLALALGGCTTYTQDALATPDVGCPDGTGLTAADLEPALSPAARQCVYDGVEAAIRDRHVRGDAEFQAKLAASFAFRWEGVLGAADDTAFYAGLRGTVAALGDGHTRFLDPEQRTVQVEARAGAYALPALGFVASRRPEGLLIASVVPGSPADVAGLRRSDRIVAVDGEPCGRGCNLPRGPAARRLGIDGVGGPREVVLVPAAFEGFHPVTADRVGPSGPGGAGTVGRIVVPTFVTDNIDRELDGALDRLLREGPLTGLIVDVRGNGGGRIRELAEVLGVFLPAGKVGEFRSRDGTTRDFRTRGCGPHGALAGLPLVVLVDDTSYSGAEIFAAVLRRQGRARIVGVATTGETEGVRYYDLPDRSRLAISIREFHLAGVAEPLSAAGVVPDVAVAPDWYMAPQDPAVAAAVELILAPSVTPTT